MNESKPEVRGQRSEVSPTFNWTVVVEFDGPNQKEMAQSYAEKLNLRIPIGAGTGVKRIYAIIKAP